MTPRLRVYFWVSATWDRSLALFQTWKYFPAYPPAAFETLVGARHWVMALVDWYNHEHRHSAIRHVTPAQRDNDQEGTTLAKRDRPYSEA